MAKKVEYAILAIHARTGNGSEVCRVGSQDVALKIAAKLRYEEVRVDAPQGRRRTRKMKYERVTTMKVTGDKMEPVVVR